MSPEAPHEHAHEEPNDRKQARHTVRAGSWRPALVVCPDEPAGSAVRASCWAGLCGLLANEPGARRGEAEGVHQMRTAARRLRGELRLYGPLVQAEWGEELEAELRWLGQALGPVRDLDVQRVRLRAAAAELAGALDPLFNTLNDRHAAALAALQEALQNDRSRVLLERLAAAANQPALTPRAEDPCRRALPPLVARAWKKLRDRGRALALDDPDEAFHTVRKRAKRARYAAEAVAQALGPHAAAAARRFARRARDVQDCLGRHQDAVVACHLIEPFLKNGSRRGAFLVAAARLLERQAQVAHQARAEFADVWERLDRKKLRRWMQ